jgi:hypothetical protein
MTYELVKWSVDLLAPGAKLSTPMLKYLDQHTFFHSRRTLYPPGKLTDYLDFFDGEVRKDFFHIRAMPIGDKTYGLAEGDIDLLLTRDPMDVVFGEADLERVAAYAMNHSQPYGVELHRTYASWIDLYEGVRFVRQLSVDEIGERHSGRT